MRRHGVLSVITTIEPDVGGPSFTAVNAAIAEREAGTQVTLASTVPTRATAATDLERRLRSAGVVHRRFGRPTFQQERSRRWGVSLSMALWLMVRTPRYEVVYVHYVWAFSSAVAVLAGKLWRVPVILVPHESLTRFDIDTSRTPARREQKLRMARALLSGVDAVVMSSELEQRDSVHGSVPTFVIAHPVKAPKQEREPSSPTRNAGELVVGFLGRLHAKKRLELLIETVAELPGGVRLVIGGDSPPERLPALRELVQTLGVSDRVDFVGFVDDASRDAFFAGIHVLAMPSRYECFGMVAAEALAAGVPVVVSDQTGVAETVLRHRAGVVFPVAEVSELGVSLCRLAHSPTELSILVANARRAAILSFSFDAYVAANLALRRELVGQ